MRKYQVIFAFKRHSALFFTRNLSDSTSLVTGQKSTQCSDCSDSRLNSYRNINETLPKFDGKKSLVLVSMAVILLIVFYLEHSCLKLSDQKLSDKSPDILLENTDWRRRRVRVVLLSYSRSGSSLLGELLALSPSASYYFEPLWQHNISCRYQNILFTFSLPNIPFLVHRRDPSSSKNWCNPYIIWYIEMWIWYCKVVHLIFS